MCVLEEQVVNVQDSQIVEEIVDVVHILFRCAVEQIFSAWAAGRG